MGDNADQRRSYSRLTGIHRSTSELHESLKAVKSAKMHKVGSVMISPTIMGVFSGLPASTPAPKWIGFCYKSLKIPQNQWKNPRNPGPWHFYGYVPANHALWTRIWGFGHWGGYCWSTSETSWNYGLKNPLLWGQHVAVVTCTFRAIELENHVLCSPAYTQSYYARNVFHFYLHVIGTALS